MEEGGIAVGLTMWSISLMVHLVFALFFKLPSLVLSMSTCSFLTSLAITRRAPTESDWSPLFTWSGCNLRTIPTKVRWQGSLTISYSTCKYSLLILMIDGFLGLETITLVPFEPKLIDFDLMTDAQIGWYNDYHVMVREKVFHCLLMCSMVVY